MTLVNATVVRTADSFFDAIAIDPVTGKVYERLGYSDTNPATNATVRVYDNYAAFQAGTLSSIITLEGDIAGTYISAYDGHLYGRTEQPVDPGSNWPIGTQVAEWDASTGLLSESLATIGGIGGVNWDDGFDWGGFSDVNWLEDAGARYVFGQVSGTENWKLIQVDQNLNVVSVQDVNIDATLGYAFVVNGVLFMGDSYSSTHISRAFDIATGTLTSVDFTLGVEPSNVYISTIEYDPAADALTIVSAGSIYRIDDASTAFETANVIDGTPDDDFLVGTPGMDIINAMAGNDVVRSRGGDDVLNGDDGHDMLIAGDGNDTLNGGNGDDYLRGGEGNDVINGGGGFDRAAFTVLVNDASIGETGVQTGATVDLNIQGVAQDTGHGMDTLIGIENVSGTAYDDTLRGDAGNNWIWGEGGNDILSGRAGNDLIQVGIGNAIVDGDEGIDTLTFFGNDADSPTGVTFDLSLSGSAQATSLGNIMSTDLENLSGTVFDDNLSGDSGDNVIAGDLGDDTLIGGAGSDTLLGDGRIFIDDHGTGLSGQITTYNDVTSIDPSAVDGDDTLEGGAGNDTLDGGGGSDTASYEHNGGPVEVFLGNGFGAADEYASDGETLLSSDTLVSIENAIGSAYGDTLIGGDGNNVLDGRGGNDVIQGFGGNDTIHGGDGNDTLQGDRGDAFIGASGDDILYGEGGNDVIRGGLGNDALYGGDGNDLMRGNGGVDYFDGGADDGEGFNGIGDRISFFEVRATQGAVADLRTGVISNDGYGNVEAMTGIESLGGDTAFADTFYGNDGRNYLFADLGDSAYGFGGDDVFQTASAAAVVDGGTGTDRLVLLSSGGWLTPDTNADGLAETVGAATAGWEVDLLNGFMFDGYGNFGTVTGIENVDGSELDDFVRGDDGNNVLSGGAGGDFLVGMGGDDTVIGGDGNDNLRGDSQVYTGGPFGNDILIGGDGDDLMRGGPGVDSFDGGSDTGTINNGFTGYGDRVSFYEPAATSGVIADLRTGIISNDGFGNVETMVGVESLGAGTAFADIFYGNDGINFLFADLGDSAYGFGGDDIFQLSSAPAIADGGDGIDRLTLSSGGGALLPDADADGIAETMAAPTAGWTVNLADGTVVDGYGNSGAIAGFENVDGSELDDTLIGDDNDNVLNGLDGNDTLDGGGGDDTLDGGNGIDTVSYEQATGPVEVFLNSEAYQYDPNFNLLGHDTLANFENVTGSAFDDFLMGDGNANVINGLDGNDDIVGGGGDDTLSGGAGEDTADYSVASGSVTVNLTTGTASGADGNDTLSGFEDVFGSNFNDHLTGDAGNNQLSGFGGADTIEGVAGNDSLRGQAGNDTLLGGDGNDFLNGGAGDDTIDGGAGYDRAAFYTGATAGVTVNLNMQGVAQNTGQGMDTLINIENVSGTTYGDTLTGDNNNNWLWGSPGDGVHFGVNNDTLDGGGGNDLLTVGIGNHSLTGGSGIDTVSFTENGGIPDPSITVSLALQGVGQATGAGTWTLNGVENLSGGLNNDTLTGDGSDNVLAGNSGDDHLVGGAGSDTLYGDGAIQIDYAGGPGTSGPIATIADVATIGGADGDDTLEGGAGSDQLYGGGGNDTASYEHNGGAVIAQLNTSTSFADEYDAAGNYLDTDILHDIENLTGSAFNDSLVGNGGANILSGLDGHDLLRGGGGNDTLLGGNGDDFLNGGFGDDYVDGGAGIDRATFATGAVAGVTVDLNVQGVAQNTGQGMDTLVNIENVSGTGFDDTLTGDGGDNWIWGQGGNDVLTGNGGNDLIQAGAPGNLSANGGTGIDTLSVSNIDVAGASVTVSLALQGVAQASGIGTYTLTGFENLSGSAGNDTLTGDGGVNILAGDQGDDTLSGGGGDDVLYGDGQIAPDSHGVGSSGPITTTGDVASLGGIDGNDTLEGGAGNDTLNGGGGSDTASYEHSAGPVDANLQFGFADEYTADESAILSTDTLVSIENLIGSAFGDGLAGSAGDNILSGLGGNDSIQGRSGNDTIYGGDGDDVLLGDAGELSLAFSGNDTLYGDNGNDIIRGGLGDDQLFGGANNDLLRGNGGVDYFDGGSDDGLGVNGIGDRVSFFDARATQGAVADLRTGVISNDGFGNVETMVNIESLGADTAFVDTFYGNDGANFIGGSRGDNLYGYGGDDVFQTGAAAALIDGGTGVDTLNLDTGGGWLTPDSNADGLAESAAAATSGWTVNLTAGTLLDGYGNAGTVTGIENVNGSVLGDTLIGNAVANVLDGGDGDDTLNGRTGNDTLIGGNGTDTASYANATGAVTVSLTTGTASGADGSDTLASIENVTGSLFADALTGDANANTLNGNDGNDTLDGRAGNDTLNGGNGTDTASYANASGSVTVSLTSGTASGADGSDTLSAIENVTGSAFADVITGGSGVNVLTGNDGNDALDGRAGNDTLNGGNGVDTASYGNATGSVSVNLNTGSATGADGSDTLTSIENVTGSQFNDTLRGDDNANVLKGGAGVDTLIAGRGDDSLYGGLGNDVMTGNQGTDRYVIEANSGNDTVTDFARGTDVIVFDSSSGVTSFSQLTITKVGSDALVSWAGGNSVLLQGVKASQLTASDFQFGSASFAAMETKSSVSGALLGTIAAAGLAELSASAPAFSATNTDSLSIGGTALHDQALAPIALGSQLSPVGGPSFASSDYLLGAAHIAPTELAGRSIGSVASPYGGNAGVDAMTQPSELLQDTAPSFAFTSGGLGLAAPAVAMASAAQLAAIAPLEADSAQSNAVVGRVLADALDMGGSHGANVEALINSLPAHDGAGTGLAALAGVAAGNAAVTQFAFSPAIGTFGSEQVMLHQDAAPTHA